MASTRSLPPNVQDSAKHIPSSSAGGPFQAPCQGPCQFTHINGLGQVPSLSVELPSLDVATLMRNPATAPGHPESEEDDALIRVIYLPDERRYYYRKNTEGKFCLFLK
jgi:hypothetical protein